MKGTECLRLSSCGVVIIVSSFVSVCLSQFLSQLSRVSNISKLLCFFYCVTG